MVTRQDWGGGGFGSCLIDTEFQFCKMRSSGNLLHDDVNIVNTTELYS